MRKTWDEAAELADAIKARAESGRNVVLSPLTALWLAAQLHNSISRHRAPKRKSKTDVDLYSEGSSIYRLTETGDIEQVDAWARSAMVGRAALVALGRQYPDKRFEQRRRAWVEGECGPRGEAERLAHRFNEP